MSPHWSTRSEELQAAYDEHNRTYSGACKLCDIVKDTHGTSVIEHRAHHIVMRNDFPYMTWFDLPVKRHLMVLPKRHVAKISELNTNELLEYITIIAEYESGGCSVYTRSPNDPTRSITHLHTHLIDITS